MKERGSSIKQKSPPGELPIEQRTKLELVLNMRTLKTLGFAVPQSLLARADYVIERAGVVARLFRSAGLRSPFGSLAIFDPASARPDLGIAAVHIYETNEVGTVCRQAVFSDLDGIAKGGGHRNGNNDFAALEVLDPVAHALSIASRKAGANARQGLADLKLRHYPPRSRNTAPARGCRCSPPCGSGALGPP